VKNKTIFVVYRGYEQVGSTNTASRADVINFINQRLPDGFNKLNLYKPTGKNNATYIYQMFRGGDDRDYVFIKKSVPSFE
jgi:hypothetical protein